MAAARPTVDAIRASFAEAEDTPALERLCRRHAKDEREGVRDMVARARRRLKALRAEDSRLEAMAEAQAGLHASGFAVVAGVDEVGRGALAGPLTACALILPHEVRIPGLDDSKALTPEQRELLAESIRDLATAFHVAHVQPSEIDALGMTAANRNAMRNAIEGLRVTVDHVLVDGIDDKLGIACTAVIDGDAKVSCIAAASIVAKVTRDALMVAMDAEYPGYGFARHKGYSTPEHKDAIDRLGLTPLHRRSFSPCMRTEPLFELE